MIQPDFKDWTWVLQKRCPECGVNAGDLVAADVAGLLRDCRPRWDAVFARPNAARRATPDRWSPVEYACHVRDALGIYNTRLERMLTENQPHFADWDQNAAAIDGQYATRAPQVAEAELRLALNAFACRLDGIAADSWARTGVRSDGVLFTVDTLARYLAHDILHHLWDVGAPATGRPGRTRGDA